MIDLKQFEGHTPAPWEQGCPTRQPKEFFSNNEVLKRNIDGSNRTKVIASANHNFPEQAEVDARLIASAPELLAELKLAREEIAYLRKSVNHQCELRMKEKRDLHSNECQWCAEKTTEPVTAHYLHESCYHAIQEGEGLL